MQKGRFQTSHRIEATANFHVGKSLQHRTELPMPVLTLRDSLAHWIRRHSILAVMTLLLTLYATLALAPNWALKTGLAGEAQACFGRRYPRYSGLTYFHHYSQHRAVIHITGISEQQDESGQVLLIGWVEAGLSETPAVGEPVVLSVPVGLYHPDDRLLCGWQETRPVAENEDEISEPPMAPRALLLPLAEPWDQSPAYQTLKFVREIEAIADAHAQCKALAQAIRNFDSTDPYCGGRMYLWELIESSPKLSGLVAESPSQSNPLADELAHAVRIDLLNLPEAPTREHLAIWALSSRASSNQIGQVLDQSFQYYSAILNNLSQRAPTAEVLTAWLAAVDRKGQLIYHLLTLTSRMDHPTTLEFMGRQLTRRLELALAQHHANTPTDSRLWTPQEIQQVLQTLPTLNCTDAIPLLRTIITDGDPENSHKNALCANENIRDSALAALLELTHGTAWPEIEPIWRNGFHGSLLTRALVTCGNEQALAAFVETTLVAAADPSTTLDLDALRLVNEAQREAIYFQLFQAGRLEVLSYMSPSLLRRPEVMAQIHSHWLARTDDNESWAGLHVQATGSDAVTAEQWDEFYWEQLRARPVADETKARVERLITAACAAKAETRQAALAAIANEGPAALPVLARIERQDPRLMAREQARDLLRTLPIRADLFLDP